MVWYGDTSVLHWISLCCHLAKVASSLYACLTASVWMCDWMCLHQRWLESECVATLPETVSKSVVISEEFTVGCQPVVDAGGSY